MEYKSKKIKKILFSLLSLFLIVPFALGGTNVFPKEGTSGPAIALRSILDTDAKETFEGWYGAAKKGYNANVSDFAGASADASYSYYDGNNTNPAFTVVTDDGAKNMTQLNDMQKGESLYALICSNAYMTAASTNNAIGFFLKYNGYEKTAGSTDVLPNLLTTSEDLYNRNDISNFVWRIEKVGDNRFQISAFLISDSHNNYTSTPSWEGVGNKPRASLTNDNGTVKVWPCGKQTTSSVQNWILTPVNQDNHVEKGYRDGEQRNITDHFNEYDQNAHSDGLYTIQSVESGAFLNTQVVPHDSDPNKNSARLWLGPQQTGVQQGYSKKWEVYETSHRWSEWLVLPILQDFDSSVTYGYTKTNGNGIQSTISSLSRINPHTTEVRKLRDEYGRVKSGNPTWSTIDYGSGNMHYETVYGNNITYNRAENNGNNNLMGVNGRFSECIGAKSDTGNLVDYTGRSRIQQPLANPLGEGNLVQYMNLQCGDLGAGNNRFLWTISPNGRNSYLTANRSFQDQKEIGVGTKPYPTWSENTSAGAYQNYFIIYSMNADGGFYFSPICHAYISEERENFRVLDIAAYTGEILQIWDYNYGSNSRFWLNFYASDKLETKVVDVLISLSKNGKIEEVERAYPYFDYYSSTSSMGIQPYGKSGNTLFELYDDRGNVITTLRDDDGNYRKEYYDSAGNPVSELYDKNKKLITEERIQSVYYNAAFYNKNDEAYSTKQYESRGFFYALDTAKNATVNNTVCYRLFYKYISDGESVIVKNADAIEYSKNFTINNFNNGALSPAYTYALSTKTVAPYRINMAKNLTNIFHCWYINDEPQLDGAVKIGSFGKTSSTSTTTFKAPGGTTSFFAEMKFVSNDRERYTELKINNPTKELHGMYIFCLVVRVGDRGIMNVNWPAEWNIKASDVDALYGYKFTSSNFCRLDVANNIIYHNVNENGTEGVKIAEDWLLYGTNTRVKQAFNVSGYIQYSTKDGSIPANYLEQNYKLRSQTTGADTWMYFEETIKNPNSSKSWDEYKTAYKAYYNSLNNYNANAEHKYWGFEEGFSFSLADKTNPLIHDTTINLYLMRGSALSSVKVLNADLFVDKFGTVFAAKQEQGGSGSDSYEVIYSPTDVTSDKFFKDGLDSYIYIAVATSDSKASASINSIQYFDDEKGEWVYYNDDDSVLDGYAKNGNVNDAKAWYQRWNSEYSKLYYKCTLRIKVEDLLEAFGKTATEAEPLTKPLTVRFACSGGGAGGGWFTPGANSVCAVITITPFNYNELT